MSAAVVALFLLVGLAFPLLLYVFVRAEHDQRETMDREAAERVARRDTDDQRVGRDDKEDEWGTRGETDDEWGSDRAPDEGQ